jgi:hypothetical protein
MALIPPSHPSRERGNVRLPSVRQPFKHAGDWGIPLRSRILLQLQRVEAHKQRTLSSLLLPEEHWNGGTPRVGRALGIPSSSSARVKGTGGPSIFRADMRMVQDMYLFLALPAITQGTKQGDLAGIPRREVALLWRQPAEITASKPAEQAKVVPQVSIPIPQVPSSQTTAVPSPTIDFSRLADQVYTLVERTFRAERARRGL